MKYTHFFFTLFILTACGSNKDQPLADVDHAMIVEVQTVTEQPISNELSLSGNIEGRTTVKLGFMVPGKVEYISSKEGEAVTKGQLLSQLESTNYVIAKELSDVQLNSAKDEFDRLSLMYKNGSLSESDYMKATFAVQQAQLQQKLQTKNLADTKLYSPLTGVLLGRQSEIGEITQAGTPLFILADIERVIVSAFVPETELHQIAIGQPAVISIAALNKSFAGKVTEVGAMADATARAFMIKIEVENTDLKIRPGMIAEAKITSKNNEKSILVPAESIIHDVDNQSHVYVVDVNRNKAFKRKISLGRMMENKIQVVSGLSGGETIITAGQSKLSDGTNITIVK